MGPALQAAPWWKRWRAIGSATFVVLVLLSTACSTDETQDAEGPAASGDGEQNADENTDAATSSNDAADLHSSGCPFESEGTVTASPNCVDPWPLTVDQGDVYCASGSSALVRTSAGLFALNGAASTAFPSLDPLEDIWAENSEISGTRIDIGPLIDIALDLC